MADKLDAMDLDAIGKLLPAVLPVLIACPDDATRTRRFRALVSILAAIFNIDIEIKI